MIFDSDTIQLLKDEVDIFDLLQDLDIDIIKQSSNTLTVNCFDPNHKDKNPSCYVYLDSNRFKCFSCGEHGDVLDMVKLVKNYDLEKCLRYLQVISGFTVDSTGDVDQLVKLLDKRIDKFVGGNQVVCENVPLPYHFKKIKHGDFEPQHKKFYDYVQMRGWDIENLVEYGVGFCDGGYFKDRVVFPINDFHGCLKSFACRVIGEITDDEKKYLYPTGTKIGNLIWGLDKPLDGDPIFVEGIADALRLRLYGFNSYAILGNQLTEYKIDLISKLFKHCEKIVVIPDNDSGGDTMLKWFQKLVHSVNVHVAFANSGQDVDNMCYQDIFDMVSGSINLTDYQVDYYYDFEIKE